MKRWRSAPLVLLFAVGASAQGIYSQLGEYSEKVDVSAQQPSALSLFLQQAPPLAEPSFPVASPMAQPAPVAVMAPVVAAVPVVAAKPADSARAPAGLARPKGLLTLRSMKVANSGSEGSKLFFGANSEFAMGTDAAGNFVVEQASARSALVSLDSSNTLHLGSDRVEASSVDALNGISVRGVKQWQLVQSDDFSVEGAGWSRSDVSQCAGVSMLGGFCKFSKGDVKKTFTNLPPHKQLRVVATYHFIDRWIGETGFMKLDVGTGDCAVTVWSERHAQQEAKNGISLCGNAETPEGKFAAPIDVTTSHHKDTVTVTFGSTMDDADPCDESWGISSMEIYVRN